jgi:hypothetical protein
MYFIYFTVFVLMVFTPVMVSNRVLGMSSLGEEPTEVMIILFLGAIGFAIYLWQEKKFKINFKKRIEVQKESHQIFKDLGEAYSYIGEVNRKLEIMKGTALGISENFEKRGALAYVPFFQAFALLGKSKKIIIQFWDLQNKQLLGEVKTDAKLKIDSGVKCEDVLDRDEKFLETEDYYFAKSPKDIQGVVGLVAIKRILSSHKVEDPEMLKALVAEALQLFVIAGKRIN